MKLKGRFDMTTHALPATPHLSFTALMSAQLERLNAVYAPEKVARALRKQTPDATIRDAFTADTLIGLTHHRFQVVSLDEMSQYEGYAPGSRNYTKIQRNQQKVRDCGLLSVILVEKDNKVAPLYCQVSSIEGALLAAESELRFRDSPHDFDDLCFYMSTWSDLVGMIAH